MNGEPGGSVVKAEDSQEPVPPENPAPNTDRAEENAGGGGGGLFRDGEAAPPASSNSPARAGKACARSPMPSSS